MNFRATKLVKACVLRLAMTMAAMSSTVVLLPATAEAKNYTDVYNAYIKSDFKNCVVSGNSAVKFGSASEKAKIMKLMGICQFMTKNKTSASNAFRQALSLDGNTSISAQEVLDAGVVGFFNQEKTKFLAAAKAKKAAEIAKAKAAQKTTLVVKSNVDAKIAFDGIVAGSVDRPIDADAGKNEISVSAPGFQTRTLKVNIQPNRENLVTVNLAKAKPKKKVIYAEARPKQIAKVSAGSSRERYARRPAPKKAKGDGLFRDDVEVEPGRDVASEFMAESRNFAPAPQTPYGYAGYQAAPVAAQPAAPLLGDLPTSDSYVPPARAGVTNQYVSEDSGMMAFLPFGAGQFARGDYTLGGIFLVSQGAALGMLINAAMNVNAISQQTDDQLKTLAQAYSDKRISYDQYKTKAKQVNDLEYQDRTPHIQTYTYSLYAFGALWAASTIEALINKPVPKPMPRVTYPQQQPFAWQDPANSIQHRWDVNLGIDPTTASPVYGLGISLDY